MNGTLDAERVKRTALACGFDLAGIAAAGPVAEYAHYERWAASGMAGRMGYLTDHRAAMRADVRRLVPEARSVLLVGQLYNAPRPYSNAVDAETLGWISRYAWGDDYHDVMRARLEETVRRLREQAEFSYKICIDTAPLLERSLARSAGLGWIGKNTCLIHEGRGSWFFLGALVTSLELAPDAPPPDRCGTRCIDVCPTEAIVPTGASQGPQWQVDARLCIAYLNIELKGSIPEELRPLMGRHVFGCDLCQDVCPWNRKAPETEDEPWQPREFAPPLEKLAALTREEFTALFGGSPVARANYRGFLRNVAVAMGNAGDASLRPSLERLAAHEEELVREHALWALGQIK
jgi:epoxyqueuosine reductase